jgi:hypothetical protein
VAAGDLQQALEMADLLEVDAEFAAADRDQCQLSRVRQVEVQVGGRLQVRLAARAGGEREAARIMARVAAEQRPQRAMADGIAPPVVEEAVPFGALYFRGRQQAHEAVRIAGQRHGPHVHLARCERHGTRLVGHEAGAQFEIIHAAPQATRTRADAPTTWCRSPCASGG